jgi:hypothetical protein
MVMGCSTGLLRARCYGFNGFVQRAAGRARACLGKEVAVFLFHNLNALGAPIIEQSGYP